MTFDATRISSIIAKAKECGRSVLLESEGLELLKAMGISTPDYCLIANASELSTASIPECAQLVIKVVSADILHKSDVGGVAFLDNEQELIQTAVRDFEDKFAAQQPEGFLIAERIAYDRSLGSELLIGLRNTMDFGPVLTFGPGGVYTEFLSANFKDGNNIAILSPDIATEQNIRSAIDELAIASLLTKDFRGKKAQASVKDIAEIIGKFLDFASEFMPRDIAEFEVNPFVASAKGLVALDVLITLADQKATQRPERPIAKIKNILLPESAAIIGVSEKMNIGRLILKNFIREGFAKERLYIVKAGPEEIDGCKCFPDIGQLPERVDLFVLCVPAPQIPEVITETIEKQLAESLIVIPGGLEEKAGTEDIVAKMHEAIASSRATAWKGPVINGGNCLGIISRPGRYDNMFIPHHKKTAVSGDVSPLAFISQSGAFAVSRINKFLAINPKYSITFGNQMDLTVGDYLTYLKDDDELKVFAIYLEGFKPLDGLSFIKAAREIVESGRSVILYLAGRTAAGAIAMASHTASIAGDYVVTRELCRRAGVILADSFADFEDLTRLFTYLVDKQVSGKRLGVISNAGCDCVAASDNLRNFELATFSNETNAILENIFKKCRIDSIVDVHNPIDLTPMAEDAAYEETIRAMMNDANVDVGVISCNPLAPMINAMPKGKGHREDYLQENSIVQRLIKINKDIPKAWVSVHDAGPLFDPMAQLISLNGIPTFRTIDRAMRLFDIFCSSRLT